MVRELGRPVPQAAKLGSTSRPHERAELAASTSVLS